MDISIAITRGTLFGIIYLSILIIPFGIAIFGEDALAANLGGKWWIFPISISIVIASLGPGIYAKLREKAEWTLFTEQKQYQETLVELGKQMTLTKNTNELLSWITRTVTINVGINYTRIFLWDEAKKEYTFRKGYGVERRKQYDIKLNKKNPLIMYLCKKNEPVLREEILNYFRENDGEDLAKTKKHIRNTGAELIVPAMIKDKMIGFMTLGMKKNKRIYTPEDIDMFKILSSQAALAIENAQFHEKVKESEAMLVQASKMSSIGQMASGFAHNINNPFNSILVNADYMKFIITEGGEEGLNEEDIKELEENISAIMDSAEKGGQIVKNIMRFSKPGTGEKKVIELKEIIKESLKLSESKIKEVKADVEMEMDNKIKVFGDDIQLEQVVMNILTNAADAVSEKESERKIFIKTHKDKDKAIIEVKDTGSGISEKDKERIFDYFYTTKRNAGTGLGMALSYQIVKAHDGEIIADNSEEGGALITVKLPLS